MSDHPTAAEYAALINAGPADTDDGAPECRACHATMTIGEGAEPTAMCHPCSADAAVVLAAAMAAPPRADVAALVEEARRSDHAADDLNPCAVRYGEPCNCGVATHNARIDRLAAALAAQGRDLADAHAALNGHATAGLPLVKRIAAALGTHAHDLAEMQRRIEEQAREVEALRARLEAVRDAGVIALRIATDERAEARGRAAFHEEQSRIRGERLNAIGEAIGYGPGWEGLAIEAGSIVEQLGAAREEAGRLRTRLAEVEQERDAATQRAGWANAATAEARREADRAIEALRLAAPLVEAVWLHGDEQQRAAAREAEPVIKTALAVPRG